MKDLTLKGVLAPAPCCKNKLKLFLFSKVMKAQTNRISTDLARINHRSLTLPKDGCFCYGLDRMTPVG